MTHGPEQLADWRSKRLNAAGRPLATALSMLDEAAISESKLPVGLEPRGGSSDWTHRCAVKGARLVPEAGREVRLHALGLPRPQTPDGWPMPFAGKDPDDPCATERELEVFCARERRCQVCGMPIPLGTAFAVRRPGRRYLSQTDGPVPWIEGRAGLHLRCLRSAIRYCPELIRQIRQGVAKVVREPAVGEYRVVDGLMLDTRKYADFIEPVWHLEFIRDSDCAFDIAGRLQYAAGKNTVATEVLFPRQARRAPR